MQSKFIRKSGEFCFKTFDLLRGQISIISHSAFQTGISFIILVMGRRPREKTETDRMVFLGVLKLKHNARNFASPIGEDDKISGV